MIMKSFIYTLKSKLSISLIVLMMLQRVIQTSGYFTGALSLNNGIILADFFSLPYATFIYIPAILLIYNKLLVLLIKPYVLTRSNSYFNMIKTYIMSCLSISVIFNMLNILSGYIAFCIVGQSLLPVDIIGTLLSFLSQIICLLVLAILFFIGMLTFNNRLFSYFLALIYGFWDYIASFIYAAEANQLFFGWKISTMAYTISEHVVINLTIREFSLLIIVLTLSYYAISHIAFERILLNIEKNSS